MGMDLPQGWAVANWADVTNITHGQNQKEVTCPDGIYPIYGSGGEIGRANKSLCEAGSTVVGRKGTIDKPIFAHIDFWNIDTAFGVTPVDGVLPKYLFDFCQHFDFKTLDHSTGRPSLTQTSLYGIKMPLPPLAEQHRIVAKIDALFSKLDKGVEVLQAVQQQLRIYRQAVLKWAFVQVLADTERKPVKEICSHIVDCPHSTPKWTSAGKLCLRTTNFRKGYLDLSEKNFVSSETFDERIQRLRPEANDVLYSREGAILGLACLVPSNTELCLGQRMMLMRTDDQVLPRYLMHYLNSPFIDIIVKKKTGGTASPHLNVGDVKLFEIPVPSVDAQTAIVAEIESRLSVCDKLEQIVEESLAKSQALRQSILKKAFVGQLVSQDPNDEPAEKLLERIKVEKTATTAKAKTVRRKRK
jgi:type I restriction enzyme S subunit